MSQCEATTIMRGVSYRPQQMFFRCDREAGHTDLHHGTQPDRSECTWGDPTTVPPTLPMQPDPDAVEVVPGVWRHWGLYLRGAPQPDLLERQRAREDMAVLRRKAQLAYLYLNLVTCPRCHLPKNEGYVCVCGYDG